MVPTRVGRAGVTAGTVGDLRRRTAEQDRKNWSMVRAAGSFGLVLIAVGLAVHHLLVSRV